ncbi:hypothetical protein EJ04DRAFT_525446 [Polyplosphaeria fusca]|uniref:Uncharacterized protein n=1 Tax=Polyplosphaeria fusca TaxID=682080 RepID=A0A9P4QW02_9PLEO|nr:hypothetical protein EJ04DRAFT_525446 [Polyplosphaeria fusca]
MDQRRQSTNSLDFNWSYSYTVDDANWAADFDFDSGCLSLEDTSNTYGEMNDPDRFRTPPGDQNRQPGSGNLDTQYGTSDTSGTTYEDKTSSPTLPPPSSSQIDSLPAPAASLKRQYPCPVFKAETEHGLPHKQCNGTAQKNMSGIRKHLERNHLKKEGSPQIDFVKNCGTCQEDIIDKTVFDQEHGNLCNKHNKQRRGEAADEKYDALYKKVEPLVAGIRASSQTSAPAFNATIPQTLPPGQWIPMDYSDKHAYGVASPIGREEGKGEESHGGENAPAGQS